MTSLALSFIGYMSHLRQNRAFVFLVIMFFIFLGLSILAHSPGLLQLDQRITRGFQRFRTEPLDRFFRFITVFADPLALIGAGVLASLLFLMAGRPWAAILSAVSILGLPLNYLIKQIIRRPRPDSALVNVLLPVVGRSFPSGHAMTAIMFYGLLAFFLWIHVHQPVLRVVLAGSLLLLAFGIGLSRVYLGVHWFSDVLGGWTAGFFFLVLLAVIYQATSRADMARL